MHLSFKSFWRQAHLILGLTSGIIVFISSITGALYVFKDEIESITQTYKNVASQNKEMIMPSDAFEIAKRAMPNTTIHGVAFNGDSQAVEVVYYQKSPLYYGAAYINPYSGEVIKQIDFFNTFFGIMLLGHTTLWLPPAIGTPLIKVAIIMYFILLISGLVLWWPRNRKQKSVFKFSKSPSRKLLNKELHQVLGFYSIFFILIILFTSSVWLFDSFKSGVYTSFGGKKEVSFSYPKSEVSKTGYLPENVNPIDSVFKKVKAEFGPDAFIEIHDIHSPQSSILVEVNRAPGTYWMMDYLYYDQYTLQEIDANHIYGRFNASGIPEKTIRLNYDIHSGGIGGIPGKTLAFLVCLLSASFPITGFIMWLNRRKVKKAFKNKLNI